MKRRKGTLKNEKSKEESNKTLRLMSPCRVSDERQLKAKIGVFRELVGDEYPIGLEIRIEMDDIYNPLVLEKTKANLEKLQEPIFLSLHGPFELKESSKRNFFSSKQGFKNLAKTVEFAEEIEADLINIHAHLFVSYDELRKMEQSDKLESFNKASIQRVKRDLQKLRQTTSPEIKICVENMPYCLTADTVLDPQEIIYELCFVDPEDFLQIVEPENNIFATIDVCHLAQVYDSSQLLSRIKKLGRGLGHIHLSDLGNIWQPFISLAEEGVIPGDGRIGESVYKKILAYLLEFSEKQDLGIVLEIDDKDFIKLEESKKSFERVMGWLKELKRE
ncbi:sugar phosphate isomerase/epimerase [Candidatus Parcubacteria bacterium]|nr:sugar phosphate isomerase/epimerase [Candidatus Parcubacteria bacterium]